MKILVTGAGRGLGYELVKEGVKRGHEVIAGYRSESQELNDLIKEYREQVFPVRLDVISDEEVKKAAQTVSEVVGSIDGIVNNAGVLYGSKYSEADPITEADTDEYRKTFEVNLMGPVRVLKYFMPLVYEAEGSRTIINITSEGAALRNTGFHYVSYAASKAALNSYTQRIRNYLKSSGDKEDICVAMIHPGRMKTEMGVENGEILPEVSAAGIWDMLERKIPLDNEIPFYDYKGNWMPQISAVGKEKM